MKLIILSILLLFNLSPNKDKTVTVRSSHNNMQYEYCVSVIKEYETFKSKPYELFGHHYIGYGHLIKKGESFDSISESQADSILRRDFNEGIRYVPNKLKGVKRLVAGLYAYNCGPSKMRKFFKNEMTREQYLSTCYLKGKFHKRLFERRQKEWGVQENLRAEYKTIMTVI